MAACACARAVALPLFVFPTALDQGDPLAVALRDMGAFGQAILASVLVIVLVFRPSGLLGEETPER